jgi:hypothetical protein
MLSWRYRDEASNSPPRTLHACVLQARHDKLGGPRPTLLVVSFHADDTNRAPTFDMDLDELFNPDGELTRCLCDSNESFTA